MRTTYLAILLSLCFNSIWSLTCYQQDGRTQVTCETHNNSTGVNNTENPGSPAGSTPGTVKSCVIKQYYKDTALSTEYLCDTESLCNKYTRANTTTGVMATVQNVYTKLFCCGTDGCNSPEKANTLQFVETSCMHGTVKISSTISEDLVPQKCRSEMCVSKQESDVTTYGCDTEGYCVLNSIKHDQCGSFSSSKQGQTVCCCEGENCNYKPAVVKPVTTLAPMPPVRPSDDTDPTQGIVQLNWMFIGALIGALVFSGLVLFLAVIVFRRCRQQRALSLQAEYSYQQLTADLTAEDHTNDDKLLLA